MKKTLREIKEAIEAMGYTIIKIEQNRHYKFMLDTPQGVKTLTAGVSASDNRALQNMTRTLRSWKNERP